MNAISKLKGTLKCLKAHLFCPWNDYLGQESSNSFVIMARLAASAVVNMRNNFTISGVNQIMKKRRQCESIHSDGRNGVQHSGT